MPRKTASTASEHWWLQDEQSCDFCLSGYSFHVEVHCVDCDRPICPLCVVHVREERWTLCPDCDAERET